MTGGISQACLGSRLNVFCAPFPQSRNCELLPPRVGAASLRTAWNGWCTNKRFQGRGSCVFGCGCFVQEDSIEHYAGCRYCVSFLRERLHFEGPVQRGHLIVLGVNTGSTGTEDLMRLALWIYVLYRTYNRLRHMSIDQRCNTQVRGIMEQYLRDAVCGHDGATTFLNNCWDQGYRHQTCASSGAAQVQDVHSPAAPKAEARQVATQHRANRSSHAFWNLEA